MKVELTHDVDVGVKILDEEENPDDERLETVISERTIFSPR